MKTHIITVLRAQALKSESMRRNPAFFHFLTVDPWDGFLIFKSGKYV